MYLTVLKWCHLACNYWYLEIEKSYRKLSLCCPRKLMEQDGAWPLHGTVNAYYCTLPVLHTHTHTHTRLWKRHEFEYVSNNAGTEPERLPIVTHTLCAISYYLSARAGQPLH